MCLNLTSVSGPFSNMIQQFLTVHSSIISAAVAVGFIGCDCGQLGQSRFTETTEQNTIG